MTAQALFCDPRCQTLSFLQLNRIASVLHSLSYLKLRDAIQCVWYQKRCAGHCPVPRAIVDLPPNHQINLQLDKLVISQVGFLAQRRLARGVKLNYSEATVRNWILPRYMLLSLDF